MSATEDGHWEEGDTMAREGPTKEGPASAGTLLGDRKETVDDVGGKEVEGGERPPLSEGGAGECGQVGGNGPELGADVGDLVPEPEGEEPTSPESVVPPPRPETARTADPGNTFYLVKWVSWKGEKTPLISQSENGPCPLIAIINILLLRWKVKLPPKTEVISVEQLMILLGDYILTTKPKENSEGLQLNFEQNMNDAMTVLPKLSTGLDVNVRFTGVRDFEYTPECIVFDLLDIPLYHGWLVDPQSCEVIQAVGRCSYNQLVEKIISSKQCTDSTLVSEGLVAEQFLDATATQLTYHGLCELTAAAKEDELCVFFRNNHFSTMIKHKGHLYLLVTDQGFLSEPTVVWESLHNVEGDGNFCDSEFCLTIPAGRQLSFTAAQAPQQQIDQDYMVALSLQQQQQGPRELSDVELAKRLQEEEDQQALHFLQQQEHDTQPHSPTSRQSAGSRRPGPVDRRPPRQDKSRKECCIL